MSWCQNVLVPEYLVVIMSGYQKGGCQSVLVSKCPVPKCRRIPRRHHSNRGAPPASRQVWNSGVSLPLARIQHHAGVQRLSTSWSGWGACLASTGSHKSSGSGEGHMLQPRVGKGRGSTAGGGRVEEVRHLPASGARTSGKQDARCTWGMEQL